jgi:WD40 repeat protein
MPIMSWMIYLQAHEKVFITLLKGSVQRNGYITKHAGAVNSVAFHPQYMENNLVASAGKDGKIKLVSSDTGTVRKLWEPNYGIVKALNFSSHDGRTMAAGFAEGRVVVFDVEGGQETCNLRGHTGIVYSVAFSPDGRLVASGSSDETVRIWDVATGQEIMNSLRGHKGKVYWVAFSPDGRLVASAGLDHTVRIWDLEAGTEATDPLLGHTKEVNSVMFSPDGMLLASGSDDNTVRIWDVATGNEARNSPMRHLEPVASVSFSPDGKLLASGSWDHVLRVWDVATGNSMDYPKRHTDVIRSVGFSADGKFLVSASEDRTVRIWHVEAMCADNIRPSSHDGTLLPANGNERVADEEVREHPAHRGEVNSVAFSPDGKLLASGGDDQIVKIWDVSTGQEAADSFRGHTGYVMSVAFSPDGKLLASGGKDETVRVWDVEKGLKYTDPLMYTLRGHTNWVYSVAFSSNSRLVASAGFDNAVRVWDVSAGKEAMDPLPLKGDMLSWIGVAPDIAKMGLRVKKGSQKQIIYGNILVKGCGDQVVIYLLLDRDSAQEVIAEYRVPADISSMSSMGYCICIGLVDGQVGHLSFSA